MEKKMKAVEKVTASKDARQKVIDEMRSVNRRRMDACKKLINSGSMWITNSYPYCCFLLFLRI